MGVEASGLEIFSKSNYENIQNLLMSNVRLWGNRFNKCVCQNVNYLINKLILISKYEGKFKAFEYGGTRSIGRGLNCLLKQNNLLKGPK
jgi:hypothetical protein